MTASLKRTGSLRHIISAAILLLLVMLCAPNARADGGLSGANIQDGVLVGYYGEDSVIVIPNTVTMIAGEAFKGNEKIVSVTIPGSVSAIGYSAFQGCPNLEQVIFSEPEYGAEMIIRINAFSDCPKLVECEIPAVATYVTANVFKGCTSMTEIKVHPRNPYYATDSEGVLFGPSVDEGVPQYDDRENWALTAYPSGRGGSYTVPKEVGGRRISQIWAGAFTGAAKLSEINLQENIKIIGGNAFEGTGLTSMNIPDTVTQVGSGAFEGCAELKEVSLPSSISSLGQFLFLNCTSLQRVDFSRCTNLTTLGMYAFQNCDSMTSFVIPSTVRVINSFDLRGMKNLARVYIPASVTSFPIDEETGAYNFMAGASPDLIVYVVSGSTGEKWKTFRADELGLNIQTVSEFTAPSDIDAGSFSLVDMGNKIKLSGEFHLGDALRSEVLSSGEEYAAFLAARGEAGAMKALRLALISSFGAPDEMELAAGVPTGMKASTAALYAYKDGAAVKLGSEASASTIKAAVDSLGCFAIIDKNAAAEPDKVTGITLNKNEAEIEAGKSIQLYANLTPATAADKTVTWASSAPNVAAVSAKGLVTGVNAGKAVISAYSANGLSASCTVTVKASSQSAGPASGRIGLSASVSAASAKTSDGKAPFTLSFSNAERVAAVTVEFSASGDEVAVAGRGGFTVLGGVNWKIDPASGEKAGSFVLCYLDYKDGEAALFSASSSVPVAILSVSGDNPSVRIKSLKVSGWTDSNEVKYGAVDSISPADAEFSASLSYDANADGKIDQLDLTSAQKFYRVQKSDAAWSSACACDFNGDGTIDIQDLLDILLHFTE